MTNILLQATHSDIFPLRQQIHDFNELTLEILYKYMNIYPFTFMSNQERRCGVPYTQNYEDINVDFI